MRHALRHVLVVLAVALVVFVDAGLGRAQKRDEARIEELRQLLKDKEAEIAKNSERLDVYRNLHKLAAVPQRPSGVTDADRLKYAQNVWLEVLLTFGSPTFGGLAASGVDTPEEEVRQAEARRQRFIQQSVWMLEEPTVEALKATEEWHLINQELAIAEGRGSPLQTPTVNAAAVNGGRQRQVGVVTSVLSDLDDPVTVLSSHDPPAPRGPFVTRDRWASLAAPFQLREAPRSSSALPLPSAKVFFTSLGRSSGEAVRMTVINDGDLPIRLRGDAFALVPLDHLTPRDVQREMQKLAGRKQVTVNIEAYCLDFRKPPPSADMVMGLADPGVQTSMAPIQDMVRALRRLHQRGALQGSSDVKSRAQTLMQWAIWTRDQRFDEAGFSRAFVEHAKQNIAAAGRKWTRELEQAVTAQTPRRWTDIQTLLREAASLEAAR